MGKENLKQLTDGSLFWIAYYIECSALYFFSTLSSSQNLFHLKATLDQEITHMRTQLAIEKWLKIV